MPVADDMKAGFFMVDNDAVSISLDLNSGSENEEIERRAETAILPPEIDTIASELIDTAPNRCTVIPSIGERVVIDLRMESRNKF